MVELDSAFACGNGRLVSEAGVEPIHVQTRGEGKGTGGYFCFELRSDEDKRATVEVSPDPASLPKRKRGRYLFHSDLVVEEETNPGGSLTPPLWIKRDDEWERVPEDDYEWTTDRLTAHVEVASGDPVIVASVPVLTPQEVSETIRTRGREQSHCAAARSPGNAGSEEPVAGLYVTDNESGATHSFWIVAGARGGEFPGQWAALGAAEWLTGTDDVARWARRRWKITIVPQLNRDGAEAGNPTTNASGHDVFRSFAWAATGRRCECPDCRATRPRAEAAEAAMLWQKVRDSHPGLYLEFRGTRQCRLDGTAAEQWFHVPSQLYAKGRPRGFHEALDTRILSALPAEGSGGFGEEPLHSLLHWIGGRFNVPAYLYRVHASRGPEGSKEFGARLVRTLVSAYRELCGEE